MKKRYYIINVDLIENDEIDLKGMSDETFMTLAEEQGTVYTQDGFVEAFNENVGFSTENCFLRIINTINH